jgi:hypothetical protein
LPVGWNTTSAVNALWTWRNTAPLNYFTRGIINSTTASNGFIIFRADSISSVLPTAVLDGYITSPPYNFANNPEVGVEFQQWYTNFNDSCFLEVNNNNGSGWVAFDVNPNNQLNPNEALPVNPNTAKINISSVAGGEGNVQIRFHYMGPAGGSYSWLIDYLRFTVPDAFDAGLYGTSVLRKVGRFVAPIGLQPLVFADTVWPVTLVNNFGGLTTGVVVNNKIFRGNTSLYSRNFFADTLNVNLFGGFIDNTDTLGIVPSVTGLYSAVGSVNVPGDADPTNDRDTVRFIMTDSSWSNEYGTYKYAFWLARPPQNGNPAEFTSYASRILVQPEGASDTVTSVSVAFHNATTPGVKVQVQLFRFDIANAVWEFISATKEKTLTAADISPAGSQQFTNFVLDYEQFPLTIVGDAADTNVRSWAAVVQLNGVPTTSTVRVWGTDAPAYSVLGSSGGIQTQSANDGSATFGTNTLFNISNAAPAIRINFGSNAKALSVAQAGTNGSIKSTLFPNPASDYVKVNYTIAQAGEVSIRVANAMGQEVYRSAPVSHGANVPLNATIPTSALPAGVYSLTIASGKTHATQRFVVVR